MKSAIFKKPMHYRALFGAILAITMITDAAADWLAADPGTQVSVQVNINGDILIRPLGGAWTHPVCTDLSVAFLTARHGLPFKRDVLDRIYTLLLMAAANGRTVNLFADPELCSGQGFPLIRAAKLTP